MGVRFDSRPMTRRDFLGAAARVGVGVSLSGGLLQAADRPAPSDDLERYDFILARVRFKEGQPQGQRPGPDVWNVRPGGDANLLEELSSVVRCKVKAIYGADDWSPQYAEDGQLNAVVTWDQADSLVRYPFLFMTGENYFDLTPRQTENLRRYILQGGFLLMDDCVIGNSGDFFFRSSMTLLTTAFGQEAVRRIPLDHEVFRNVYDMGSGLTSLEFVQRRAAGLPYMHGQDHGAWGVFMGERLAVLLSSVDLHCGWCDRRGVEFGRASYEKAIQMGINIIVYALTH